MISDQDRLDAQPIEEWVRKTASDALWERLWRPLLDSKFDGRYDDLPATFLWSRTRRSAATRDKGWSRGDGVDPAAATSASWTRSARRSASAGERCS